MSTKDSTSPKDIPYRPHCNRRECAHATSKDRTLIDRCDDANGAPGASQQWTKIVDACSTRCDMTTATRHVRWARTTITCFVLAVCRTTLPGRPPKRPCDSPSSFVMFSSGRFTEWSGCRAAAAGACVGRVELLDGEMEVEVRVRGEPLQVA